MDALADLSPFQLGVLGSFLAGMATAVGALPVLAAPRMSERTQDMMLGFGAGVMLSASFFSLILPALEAATSDGGDPGWYAASIVSVGIALGAVGLWLAHRYTPHQHFVVGYEGPITERLRKIWLFVIAITLHNFPEGLAVGVGFGGGDVDNGIALAIGIGLQNMPEGLVVAVALISEGYGARRALFISLLTGLVEPIGGIFGAGAVALASPILPAALAFAAGAMVFVVSHEIIPETHRRGFQMPATSALMVGLLVMLMLDVGLG
jgi:ZIP family zinc transporter